MSFAVILDEITPQVDQAVMSSLLRGNYENLVVIGAAVPSEEMIDVTANFYGKFGLSDLALRESDSDFLQMVGSISGDTGNHALTSKICTYILNQCGGYLYPTFCNNLYIFRRAKCAKDNWVNSTNITICFG